MKKLFFTIFFTLLVSLSNVFASNPEAYFYSCNFSLPNGEAFVETYLSILGNSLEAKKTENGQKYAEVEITIFFKQQNEIKSFKKYTIKSPSVPDSIIQIPSFIDLQRFSIPQGNYEIEINLTDLNAKQNSTSSINQEIALFFDSEKVQFSDIELIESYQTSEKPNMLTKSGYDLIPYVSTFFPKSMQKLMFYTEIYNTNKATGIEDKFLLNYYLENADNQRKISDFSAFARKNAAQTSVFIGSLPIDNLPSGNYNLVLEVRNKTNELVASKKLYFQRSNQLEAVSYANNPDDLNTNNTFVEQYKNADTLNDFLGSILPICREFDRTSIKNAIKSGDIGVKQRAFYSFWLAKNNQVPELEWNEYRKKVIQVNQLFGTKINKGYETDRGRIYLQYGAPNTIVQKYYEPAAYPYEIWHYYKIEQFTNKKFVFYNLELTSNEFVLLHSDLRGETNNPRWQVELMRRTTTIRNVDAESIDNHHGSDVDDMFRNPR